MFKACQCIICSFYTISLIVGIYVFQEEPYDNSKFIKEGYDGKSCDDELLKNIASLELSPYTSICNGRFKGGYITRAYGQPANNIHAIQLELSQATYMDEPSDHYNDQKAGNIYTVKLPS